MRDLFIAVIKDFKGKNVQKNKMKYSNLKERKLKKSILYIRNDFHLLISLSFDIDRVTIKNLNPSTK